MRGVEMTTERKLVVVGGFVAGGGVVYNRARARNVSGCQVLMMINELGLAAAKCAKTTRISFGGFFFFLILFISNPITTFPSRVHTRHTKHALVHSNCVCACAGVCARAIYGSLFRRRSISDTFVCRRVFFNTSMARKRKRRLVFFLRVPGEDIRRL